MIVTRMNMKKNVSIFDVIIINKQNSRNDETFRDTNKKGEAEQEKKKILVFFFLIFLIYLRYFLFRKTCEIS